MAYRCTKTYGHDLGLSAAFRQWRAKSHCRFVHGYALSFRLVFEADELDDNGWVIDFGGLKAVKEMLERTFDHKVLVAADDPQKDWFLESQSRGLLEVTLVENTGAEWFASIVFGHVTAWLEKNKHTPRVRLVEVECREHGANGATVMG
jgi:6-pyruvoyltetrahydropterin/6-carboxytetrahydropterin synthase